MKAFFTVGVVAALLMIAPLELQAAPRGIASHAMGQAVEELKQLIQSMKEKAGANYYGGYYDQSAKSMGEAKADYIYDDQSAIEAAETQSHHELKSLKQFLESNLATAQVRGVQINNCGFIGTLLQLILQSALGPLSSSFGVLVDCRNARGCLQVRVDAPADVRKAEVNVCTSGGRTCVEVFAETPCPAGQGITIPIVIPIPTGGAVTVSITVGRNCANVQVITALPSCPPRG